MLIRNLLGESPNNNVLVVSRWSLASLTNDENHRERLRPAND